MRTERDQGVPTPVLVAGGALVAAAVLGVPVHRAARRFAMRIPERPLGDLALGADLLLRPRTPQETAAIRDALAGGTLTKAGTLPDWGVNGILRTKVAEAGDVRVETVTKELSAGGAREMFAAELAQNGRFDHLLPQQVWRDGALLMELVPGATLADQGIDDWFALEKAMRRAYAVRHPELPADELARRVRIDRQLMLAFDYILGNTDRHHGNVMFDEATGSFYLIDHGLLGDRGMDDALRPFMADDFVTGAPGVRTRWSQAHVELEPEVVAIIRGIDLDAVRASGVRLMDREQSVGDAAGAYANQLGDGFVDDVIARIRHVTEHGSFVVPTI